MQRIWQLKESQQLKQRKDVNKENITPL